MSFALFHEAPAGAIETFFDEQNQSPFKRADLRKHLGISDIRHNFKVLDWYFIARASIKKKRDWDPFPWNIEKSTRYGRNI